ncbi:MAG TPA: hypothetical protein VNL92_03335, partial [Dehalococcoidia bacterium]|nr:hypothetical protein [Dehalococcoidia bacterium]
MTTEQTAGTELLPGREALDHAAERIEELLEGDQEQAAAQALAQLHPADEADIVRDIEPALRARLLPHIEAESLAHIIEQLDGRDRGRLVNQLPRPTLARVLDRTDSDVAADV